MYYKVSAGLSSNIIDKRLLISNGNVTGISKYIGHACLHILKYIGHSLYISSPNHALKWYSCSRRRRIWNYNGPMVKALLHSNYCYSTQWALLFMKTSDTNPPSHGIYEYLLIRFWFIGIYTSEILFILTTAARGSARKTEFIPRNHFRGLQSNLYPIQFHPNSSLVQTLAFIIFQVRI